jgi:hypothetical protein
MTFKFKRGEKGRVKNMFTYTSEAMGIRDASRFDEVLDMMMKYVTEKTKEWLKWDSKRRSNYLGFLEKQDEIEIFVRGEQITEGADTSAADGLEIAGRSDEASWDF